MVSCKRPAPVTPKATRLFLQESPIQRKRAKRAKREARRVSFAPTVVTAHAPAPSTPRETCFHEGPGRKHPSTAVPREPVLPCTPGSQIATEAITIISSRHGRDRRRLREISKITLQQAIKYGVKTKSTHKDPKTGLHRWMFTFANVVYVTDYTCRVEVTSFREPLKIQRVHILPAMQQRHQKSLQMRTKPMKCTSYTYVIMDQSSSMRTSDVKGFVNRSQAAFGCLALEYVSKQLCSQEAAAPSQKVDVFTLVEMRQVPTETISRAPLDWVLFNQLLDCQKNAKPKFKANYRPAIRMVLRRMRRQVKQLRSVRKILPPFVLIFVSDGRPDDLVKESAWLDAIGSICQLLRERLTVIGIQVSHKNAQTSVLEKIVEKVTACGSNGRMIQAGVSATDIADGIASARRSITTARMSTILSTIHEESEEVPHEVVKLSQRNNMVGTLSHQDWNWQLKNVRRYHLQYNKWRKNPEGDAWKATTFASITSVGFVLDPIPFGKGAERLAYRLQEVDRNRKLVGKVQVAKKCLHIMSETKKEKFLQACVGTQLTAMQLAQKFNGTTSRNPNLKPKGSIQHFPVVRFIRSHIYRYSDDQDKRQLLLVEQMLNGKFTKFTGNNGYVHPVPVGPTIEFSDGVNIQCSDVLHAFSHWTYFQSDGKLLVCDLQGVLNCNGKAPKFELTDPAICSWWVSGRKSRFGTTDIGAKGMRNFAKTHQCNFVCKSLGLPMV